MNTGKHINPYTASDIEKYRKGELSALEMHDLERAALDDPFLADAIDGLTTHAPTPEDLTDLRERLNRKVADDTRHTMIFHIRRRVTIAAALILLLGIGYISFIHHGDHTPARSLSVAQLADTVSRSTVAANAPAPKPAPVAANPPASKPAPVAANHHAATHRHRLPASITIPAQSEAATYASAAQPPTPPETNRPDSAKASRDLVRNEDADVELKSLEAVRLTKDSTTFGLARNRTTFKSLFNGAASSPLVFSGKVLDPQNHPLAGAFLALNGNYGFGTTTDEQGYFRISLHPRDSTRELTVSLIGYDHASLAVYDLSTEGRTNNIIHLTPRTTNLDEVVVVGYGTHRKEALAAAPSESDEKLDTLWSHAAPVIGRQAYLQYLNVAKKKLGLDSTVSGTETVSFNVARDGSLSAYKIEQSLSPAHDAGTLRLVTDGPAWHLIRGKKVRVSVTVKF